MTLSVLICTYNRPDLLERTLRSLLTNVVEPPDEVVVVNGGDDRADRAVAQFQAGDQSRSGSVVRLIKTVNFNLATSRNIGMAQCRGDIIAMTDDDAEVFPDWVAQMKRVHQEHPEAGAVGGVVLGTNTDSLVGQVADVITFPAWSGPRHVRTLAGVNISYKRTVLDLIGPQDVTLFRGEDVDYNWRVQQAGYKIYFDPTIKVYHYHRPTLKGFLNQHFMYGRAYYLVRGKWPEMYCVYPRRIRGVKDLLKAVHCVVALLYQPFLSARQVRGLSTQAAAVPMLFLAGCAWKGGMVSQAWRGHRADLKEDTTPKG